MADDEKVNAAVLDRTAETTDREVLQALPPQAEVLYRMLVWSERPRRRRRGAWCSMSSARARGRLM